MSIGYRPLATEKENTRRHSMTDNPAPAATDPATANRQAAYLTVGATLLVAGVSVAFPLVGALVTLSAAATLGMEQVINFVFGQEEPEKPKPAPLAVEVWNGLAGAFSLVKADLRHRFFGGPKLEEEPALASVAEPAAPAALAEKTAAKDFEAGAKPAVPAVAQAPVPAAAPAPKL
jgi:hypothetical protein